MPRYYNQPEEVRQKGIRRAVAKSREVRGKKRLERIEAVRELTLAGKSPAVIATELEVNVKTVYRALETLREKGEI